LGKFLFTFKRIELLGWEALFRAIHPYFYTKGGIYMGQNIFIFVHLGALVLGFVYMTFIRPKHMDTTEEPKEEVKPEPTPASTSKTKKKK
jgi:hypothetical protein